MLSLIAAAISLNSQESSIVRDSYGVPMIKANTVDEAFMLMGQAVAEDRLWQLEMSRRTSLGQMSEVFGAQYIASDQATLAKQYTQQEYADMIDQVPGPVKAAWESYVKGINLTIQSRKNAGTLPDGYSEHNFEPRPWTIVDSAAIMVNLSRQFGQGGAGELRNYALVQYLKTRPQIQGRVLDVLNDLAWENEPSAPVTVERRDDTVLNPPKIFSFSRQDSEKHLDSLPPTNLLELAGAIRLASMEDQKIVAETHSVPFKSGSYAIVVSGRRSETGRPILLTAPQMGHNSPSIVHEAAIDTPSLKVAGMNVPGIPGILIGYTPNAAWGLTSGVADLEDIFVSSLDSDSTYIHAGISHTLEEIKFVLKVKGQEDKEFIQYRTVHGPVLLRSKSSKAIYSLKSAFWKKEILSNAAIFDLYSAQKPSDFSLFASKIPVSFNLFFATQQGDIGYRFCGQMPLRASGVDPRLPTLDQVESQWRGFVNPTEMPRSDNPDTGLITNWNNKPVAWWPNGDTPVWGKTFRSSNISQFLLDPKLTTDSVEKAAFQIARSDKSMFDAFHPIFSKQISHQLESEKPPVKSLWRYNGQNIEGTPEPTIFFETINQLRRELFLEILGNFTSDSLFNQVLQPDIVLSALNRKTHFDYLGSRTESEVVLNSITKAVEVLTGSKGSDFTKWGYLPGVIRVPEQPAIPYNNRGTYIQITQFNEYWPSARSVASPGTAEKGVHASSQVPLARNWQYKVMWGWE